MLTPAHPLQSLPEYVTNYCDSGQVCFTKSKTELAFHISRNQFLVIVVKTNAVADIRGIYSVSVQG